MTGMIRTGRCLCNKVNFEINLESLKAHVCHCTMCVKNLGGSPAIALNAVFGSLKIKEPDTISWYQSSEHGQRGFCKTCGTALFCKAEEHKYLGIGVGVLSDTAGVEIDEHIFIDFKPDYYDFKDDCPRLTEAEFYDKILS